MMRYWMGLFPACVGCVLLAACSGPQSSEKQVTETRTVAAPAPVAAQNPHAAPAAPAAATPEKQAFTWTAPPGWQETPPKPMRQVNFTVGEPPGAECYVSVLEGSGGGAEMNINRGAARWAKSRSSPKRLPNSPRLPC